jgi:hypothetical protein
MSDVIGTILSNAVAVAISPLPIFAVILILFTPEARSNSLAFLAGWLLGLIVVGGAVLLSGGFGSEGSGGSGGSTLSGIIQLVFGLLLVFAVRLWRTRPGEDEEPKTPRWMAGVDQFGPVKSIGLAALLSGINPKNLALTLSAAPTIGATGVSTGSQVFGLVLFVALGSITVAAPVIFYQLRGQRAERGLNRMKDWLIANNSTVMMVLLVVFGAKLLGEGVGILFG